MIVTSTEHRWYAIQTTSGHENKVRSLIQRRIDADPRPADERAIRQALVPTQEAVEIKNGKKVNVERKIYPGYVLVEMVMDQETAHTINGIQGVGQAVAITEGPFTDFNGTVEEVLTDKGKVRVSVSLFGRPTSVELDYLQLKGY
jgi:transcriptional antiterminator NusG